MFFVQSKSICLSQNDSVNLQAVMESDFSVSQFQFLERLLRVHGQWTLLLERCPDWNYQETIYLMIPFIICMLVSTAQTRVLHMLGYSLFVVSLGGFFCF